MGINILRSTCYI